MHRRLAAAAALFLAGCTASAPPPAPAPGPKAELGAWGFDLAGMDKTVKPGDDFYAYANGTWDKRTDIPSDRASIGSFDKLQILSEERMKGIVAELEAKPADQRPADETKLKDLYDSFLDEKTIEARGLDPAKPDLERIAKLKSLKDVAQVMGSTSMPAGSLYGLSINVDDKHPDSYSVNVTADGLGMPDRDFYLLDSPDLVKVRDAYKTYLIAMLGISGATNAQARAEKVLALETAIAKAHWPIAEQRDPDKMYAPMSVKALIMAAPQFPWDAFFSETGIPLKDGERQVIVGESTAIPVLAKVFAATPVAVWRDFLTVQYLHNSAKFLPNKIYDTNFAFYGTVLSGQAQPNDRATRGVRLLDDTLGEAFGKIYAAKYFPPSSKAKVEALVANLLKAYEADIKTLTWMSDATKAKALEKINRFTPYIGYPDKWRDYSGLTIDRSDLLGNAKRSNLFEWNRQVARLDQPVDKAEWQMTPSTVNAYYIPQFNSITFAAAILQPPFFDPNADDAVNYGAIGAVIGHEISHGFDDEGSKYAASGVLQNWWTAEDRTNFEARTKLLVNQFDTYEPLPGLHIRGANTLGENIADLAGLSIALKAYRISLGGKPAPMRDGFTGEQRLFLAFAQVWRAKNSEGVLRTVILSDVHSPEPFRARGAVRNIDDWYSAFDVKQGDKYYLPPEQRVKLW